MGVARSATVTLLFAVALDAQICRLSVAGLNQNRRVLGPITAECSSRILHTTPFGNWGVTSNFGTKRDGHQFDGWCHDTRICDNAGNCRVVCRDGWYEWNSCTEDSLYRAPNCSLYNDPGCAAQVSTMGVNVLGTRTVDVPVACPSDLDGDGRVDRGGCTAIQSYSSGTNFMSLYELDPVCCDDLVQTLYFPSTTVPLACDVWGCAPGGSPWVAPAGYDSPATPVRVSAEMAVVVNWGAFVDPGKVCSVSQSMLTGVSAASLTGPAVAPDSLATLRGESLAAITASATLPWPTTLGGVSVEVADRFGVRRPAQVFYVAPGQINFVVPAATAPGPATVSVFRGDVLRASGRLQVDLIAPGLFTAASTGRGLAAAIALGATPQLVADCTSTGCVARPIDLPAGSETYLVLFGTGLRNRAALDAVSVTIGGLRAPVQYAGPQLEYPGLDQVNVLLPPELRGRGEVDVLLSAGGVMANAVRVSFR
ncbi:MAG: hypothetical protein ACRD96_16825 [Bryobacteraceae bacterium]